jgi:hypothetical protein
VSKALGLDHVPDGIMADSNDAIIYDIGMMGKSSSGFNAGDGVASLWLAIRPSSF